MDAILFLRPCFQHFPEMNSRAATRGAVGVGFGLSPHQPPLGDRGRGGGWRGAPGHRGRRGPTCLLARTPARAHPPHKPRLAAPPPRKTAAAPPVSPHPCARALAASRARFKPAASQLPPAVTVGAARVAPLPNPFCKAGK